MKYFLTLILALFPLHSILGQQMVVADDGTLVQASLASGNSGGVRAPGSLTTHFNGGNGFAGNMFDITPTRDLEITGLDFHARNTNSYDIDVWYRVGSCVGHDTNPTSWTLLSQVTGILGGGANMGTFADLSGNGVTFQAGVTYGIYMDNVNYSVSGGIYYTNGASLPEVYSNADLMLEAYYGKATPSFTGTTFSPRVWNGTLYYDDGGPGAPTLEVLNLVAGSTTQVRLSNCTPGGLVYFAYSLAGGGPISTPFGTAYISPPYVNLPFIADTNGDAGMDSLVPAHAQGANIWFHGADVTLGVLTNSIATTIG